MNLRNGLSYLNSVHNSGCFLNYSQQFVVQELLGKDKVEFYLVGLMHLTLQQLPMSAGYLLKYLIYIHQ